MKRKVLITLGIVAFLVAVHLLGFLCYERPVTFARPVDLNRQDCRVGVLIGYESERLSRRVFTRAQIVGFNDFEEAFTALLAGNIDGFVYSDHVLNVGLRAYPNRFKILDEALADAPSVVLLSPQRGDLLPELNKFIANCRQIGVYDEMVARWCQNDVYEGMPEIPEADGSLGVLKIGTSGEEEPSSFVDDDGNLTGFDIEFARRFAQMMGLKPEIVCRPDRVILQELLDGELDMVVDNYSVQEAIPGLRASDDYFDCEMKVLVRTGDESEMMLGSTRLGYSRRVFKDPRVALLVTGCFTTLGLVLYAFLAAFALALGLWALERRVSPEIRARLSLAARIIRFVPPPVMVLIASLLVFSSKLFVLALIGPIALAFVAAIEPAFFAPFPIAIKVFRERTTDLVHWTSLAGCLFVCDLFFAVDLVCGRNLLALGPLVSVATAYVGLGWVIQKGFDALERRLK